LLAVVTIPNDANNPSASKILSIGTLLIFLDCYTVHFVVRTAVF
jgi:hypothetical protein